MSNFANMVVGPITSETEEFWKGAAKGRLMLRFCTDCHQPHHYPRSLCPFCLGSTEWRKVGGRGVVYSFSLLPRAQPPYAIAYVTLEEGVTMLTRIVGCDFDAIRIGQNVQVCFEPSMDGQHVPVFNLVE